MYAPHADIIISSSMLEYLIEKLSTESSGRPHDLKPPGYLARIILTPPPKIKPTVPLKPAVRLHDKEVTFELPPFVV